MARQVKAAILTATVAVLFVALQFAFGIQTGIAGVFVMGMAGGLLLGSVMAKASGPKPAA